MQFHFENIIIDVLWSFMEIKNVNINIYGIKDHDHQKFYVEMYKEPEYHVCFLTFRIKALKFCSSNIAISLDDKFKVKGFPSNLNLLKLCALTYPVSITKLSPDNFLNKSFI